MRAQETFRYCSGDLLFRQPSTPDFPRGECLLCCRQPWMYSVKEPLCPCWGVDRTHDPGWRSLPLFLESKLNRVMLPWKPCAPTLSWQSLDEMPHLCLLSTWLLFWPWVFCCSGSLVWRLPCTFKRDLFF